MTQRETDSFDAYYDEIADEQYEISKEQGDFPKLRLIDTSSLKRSVARMDEIVEEMRKEVTR